LDEATSGFAKNIRFQKNLSSRHANLVKFLGITFAHFAVAAFRKSDDGSKMRAVCRLGTTLTLA
jgi:hypothetical protein